MQTFLYFIGDKMARYRKLLLAPAAALLVPLAVLIAAPGSRPKGYTGQLSSRHLDASQIAFVRPGIIGKIVRLTRFGLVLL